LVNDACIITNKPLVFGAIYKFEGQVSVFNYKNGPSYRCLFPNPPEKGTVPNCSDIGVLGVLPGIIGSMQANEVLKIILGIGNVLSGKLLCFNALTLQNTILKIAKSETEIVKVLAEKEKFYKKQIDFNCEIESFEVSIKGIITKENIQFIDVRELYELPKIEGLAVTCIPLSSLENNLDKIDLERKKVIFCQYGIRSKNAVLRLKNLNIDNCYSIKEGASEIIKYINSVIAMEEDLK
jgi:adenylyltransferase/sulfurtransferase